jgi:hypothetical protein
MAENERHQRLLKHRVHVGNLWKTGIPDLQLSGEKLLQIKHELDSWALHVQEELLTKGFGSVVDKWEKLVFGLENLYCEHDGKIRRGEDYLRCCGKDDEYINDLYCRSEIAIIAEILPSSEYAGFRDRIELLDRRFREVSKDSRWVVNTTGAEKYAAKGYWWFFGFPEVLKRK